MTHISPHNKQELVTLQDEALAEFAHLLDPAWLKSQRPPVREMYSYPKVEVTDDTDECRIPILSFGHVLACGHRILTLTQDEACAPNCHHVAEGVGGLRRSGNDQETVTSINGLDVSNKDFFCDACVEEEIELKIPKNVTSTFAERHRRIFQRAAEEEYHHEKSRLRKCEIGAQQVKVLCRKDGTPSSRYVPFAEVINTQPPTAVIVNDVDTTDDEDDVESQTRRRGHAAERSALPARNTQPRAPNTPLSAAEHNRRDREFYETVLSSRQSGRSRRDAPAVQVARARSPRTELLRRYAEKHRRAAARQEASKRQRLAVATCGHEENDTAEAQSRSSKRRRSALENDREYEEDAAAPPTKRRRNDLDDGFEDGGNVATQPTERRRLVPTSRKTQERRQVVPGNKREEGQDSAQPRKQRTLVPGANRTRLEQQLIDIDRRRKSIDADIAQDRKRGEANRREVEKLLKQIGTMPDYHERLERERGL
jgi:hypothetical protein